MTPKEESNESDILRIRNKAFYHALLSQDREWIVDEFASLESEIERLKNLTHFGYSEVPELKAKLKAQEYAYKLAEERIDFLLKRANEAESKLKLAVGALVKVGKRISVIQSLTHADLTLETTAIVEALEQIKGGQDAGK